MTATHLSFQLSRGEIQNGILIPKFYDPDLTAAEELARGNFDLHELGDLLLPGDKGSRLGSWIPREHYGTGEIPFIRTSDFANWRIRPDFKKAVSEAVYLSVKDRQDIQANDLLFVAHGTYLVGTAALVMPGEERLVLQDHVFRLRLDPATGLSPLLVLAALSTGFVRRQVRARQFSADIIDKIGERHLSIKVPIPKKAALRRDVIDTVQRVLDAQDAARREIAKDTVLQTRMTKERAESNLGFGVNRSDVRSRILVPKYYDPRVASELAALQKSAKEKWVRLSSYVEQGLLDAETGVEVGKMAYGTGSVPFLRTTDIVDLEIKRDPRHCVDEDIYQKFSKKAGVAAGDVLVVRDGTYLVGSSAMVGEDDGKSLVCGGIYRLRCVDPTVLSPASLLLSLNLPIVRKQLRSVQFTRDVIDTLGKRLLEVYVPPLHTEHWRELGARVQAAFAKKSSAKAGIGRAINLAEPTPPQVVQGRPSWSMR